MTDAQYVRIHANASPSKLRAIIRDLIFVYDDVAYLDRLASDLGGMDYVFRHLWRDGPAPCSRGEGTGDDDGGGFPHGHGRSWIQQCCYRNAHRCLRWIFREVARNHLVKRRWYELERREQMEREVRREREEESEEPRRPSSASSATTDRTTDAGGPRGGGGGDENLVEIVRRLLEYPSASYCGIHYMAIATLRNSHQCLSLLLEYGGLDPNAPVNPHGATAAHLAAWKDHGECLRVLRRGAYACRFRDGDVESGGSQAEAVDEGGERGSSERPRGRPRLAAPQRLRFLFGDGDEKADEPIDDDPESKAETAGDGDEEVGEGRESAGKEEEWRADWTRTDDLGETPLHVAAREGSSKAMQFFLDVAAEAATRSLGGEDEKDGEPRTVDFSMRNNDGMDAAAVAAQNDRAEVILQFSMTIERLVDASIDGPVELPSPVQNPDFWLDTLQSTLGLFQSQARNPALILPTMKAPPQSPMHTNRRRATSEPFNIRPIEPSPVKKLLQSPHRHRHQSQCLPDFFPTLNLRNSLEERNHEMPIHVAARRGNCNVIEALFKSGNCDVTARDSLGQTALHVAALEGHADACQMFVYLAGDEFDDFDVVDVLGRTPLYISCSLGYPSLARTLAPVSNWRVVCHERRKAPDGPLYVDVARRPPLHAAVANDHCNTVDELLGCGVDVDQTDAEGRTAISAAAKLGYYEMCQKLILHGADVNKRYGLGFYCSCRKFVSYSCFVMP
ncbi:hypothetical protein ACHAWF_017386 [Thalassiosira exigua]